MNNFKKLLDKLVRELVILYEYSDKLPSYPIEFHSGLDVLEDESISKSFSKNTPKEEVNFSRANFKKERHNYYRNFQKFQAQNIIRNKDSSFTYIPLNKTYPSIFECIRDLVEKFSIADLLTAFTWQEFEEFISLALNHYGYHAFRTFRFSISKKRHEVDVIARERNDILFIDAKRWNSKTANESALIKAAHEQNLRAEHLITNPTIAGKLLQKLHYPINQKFKNCRIYSIILVSSNLRENFFVNGVAILDFAHFNAFLNNFQSIKINLKSIKLSKVVFQKKLIRKL
ncbi:MAG: restriction endonuclease [Promethearchaeota archaeon]